tara:strand:+ start:11027 stop:12007 length:981 start_codon:yes stop_codon:yes gene_type:complete
MSKRPNITTHDYLINAALPEQTDTYTVISHAAVISKTKDALTQKGFEIVRELYRCNEGAQVAQGVYHLKYDNDPNTDMGMLFAWANSYDKSMRFKCSIGAYVHTSLASIIGGNMDTFGRKHTGSADEEVFNKIDEQITNAELYFTKLVNDKEAMKVLVAPTELRASFMGRLYFINELVTGEQLGIIKSEFKKPSFVYKGIENSVWGMYNAIIYALQKAHPKTWMDQQRMIHYLLCKEYNITPDFVQPESLPLPEVSNQLDFTEELLQAEPKIVVEDAGSLNLAVPEQVVDEAMEDDSLWVCLSCGEMQGINAVFYDGQLCNKCVNP